MGIARARTRYRFRQSQAGSRRFALLGCRSLVAEGHTENEVPRGYNRGMRRELVLLKQQTGSGADQSLNKGLLSGKSIERRQVKQSHPLSLLDAG
jgi:hypothetical protein